MTRTIAACKRRESLAEEMRILYVLMTRAQDRLALVGEVSGLEKHLHAWAQGAQDPACPLDFLMPALLTHPDARALCEAHGLTPGRETDASRWEIAWTLRAQEAEAPEDGEMDLQALLDAAPDAEILRQLTNLYPQH